MAETTNLNIRIDKDLKERAEAVFADMGMSMTTAFMKMLTEPCKTICTAKTEGAALKVCV